MDPFQIKSTDFTAFYEFKDLFPKAVHQMEEAGFQMTQTCYGAFPIMKKHVYVEKSDGRHRAYTIQAVLVNLLAAGISQKFGVDYHVDLEGSSRDATAIQFGNSTINDVSVNEAMERIEKIWKVLNPSSTEI